MDLGEEGQQIISLLRESPTGKSITCISDELTLNRNLVAKYLAILTEAGKVEQRRQGPAKIYSLATAVPMNKIIDTLFDWVCVIDREGTIVQANESLARGVGQEGEKLKGKRISDLPLPGRLIGEAKRYAEAITTCPRDAEGVYRDGKTIYHAKFVPSVLETQEAGLAVIINDVTEKQRNSQQCSLFSHILEHQDEAVIVTDNALEAPGPHIVYVNEAATELTGYAKQELLGKNPRILQGPGTDKAVLRKLKRALQHGRSFTGETINYRKDGSKYDVRWTITPFSEDGRSITNWVSIQQDTSQATENEDILLRYEAQHEALRAISKAIANGKDIADSIAKQTSTLLRAPVLIRRLGEEFAPAGYADSQEEFSYDETRFTIPADDELVSKLRKKQPLTISGKEAQRFGCKELLVCPVIKSGSVVGSIEIINRKRLHPQEQSLLKTIANLAGCALNIAEES